MNGGVKRLGRFRFLGELPLLDGQLAAKKGYKYVRLTRLNLS
jgi:hypothetical protein